MVNSTNEFLIGAVCRIASITNLSIIYNKIVLLHSVVYNSMHVRYMCGLLFHSISSKKYLYSTPVDMILNTILPYYRLYTSGKFHILSEIL